MLRHKVLVNGDESYPVGMWVNGWEAGYVTAEVAEILLKAQGSSSLYIMLNIRR